MSNIVMNKAHEHGFVVYRTTLRKGEEQVFVFPGPRDPEYGLVKPGECCTRRAIWFVIEGSFKLTNADKATFLMDNEIPPRHFQPYAGPVRMRTVDTDASFVCINPENPTENWMRDRYILTPGGTNTFKGGESGAFVYLCEGDALINGGLLDPLRLIKIDPKTEAVIETTEGCNLVYIYDKHVYEFRVLRPEEMNYIAERRVI